MSDADLYVGPHVKCVVTNRETTMMIECCTNKECSLYKQKANSLWNFCPLCATPIENTSIPVRVESQFRETDGEEFNLEQWGSEYDDSGRVVNIYRVSFGDQPDGCPPWHEIDFPENIELTLNDIRDQMSNFNKFYAGDVEQLKKAYGAENVFVVWGILSLYC